MSPYLLIVIQSTIIAIAWPVLYYQPSVALVSKLVIIIVTGLLLASAVLSTLVPWRHSWAISLLLNIGAVGLVILGSDNSAYY